MRPMQSASARGDAAGVTACLEATAECLAEMEAILERMTDGCDPYIYYTRVRQPMSGWRSNPLLPDGLLYEGVGDEGATAMYIYGETGAQSSILSTIDAMLGVTHKEGWLKDYLQDMRQMMPREHRQFLDELEAAGSVRPFVEACIREAATGSGAHQPAAGVVEAYNKAIDRLQAFRGTHKRFAYTYISQFGQADSSSERGTGGESFRVNSSPRPSHDHEY